MYVNKQITTDGEIVSKYVPVVFCVKKFLPIKNWYEVDWSMASCIVFIREIIFVRIEPYNL